jgi:putative PIN family toxin of toxin-antitoxin system
VIRAVADTNVLISALVFGGLPETFLQLGLLGQFRLVTSSVLLDELDEKLRGKFEISSIISFSIRESLTSVALVVAPQVHLTVVKDDPDDDRVLECAVSGEAEFIVTGDRHLLRMGTFNGIEIVPVRDFMSSLAARP